MDEENVSVITFNNSNYTNCNNWMNLYLNHHREILCYYYLDFFLVFCY